MYFENVKIVLKSQRKNVRKICILLKVNKNQWFKLTLISSMHIISREFAMWQMER